MSLYFQESVLSPYIVDRGHQMPTVVAIGRQKDGQIKLGETGMAVSLTGFYFKIHLILQVSFPGCLNRLHIGPKLEI